MADAFQLLGVEVDATDEEVRAAYWRLARIYHPDRYATSPEDVREDALRRMTELNAAYQAIHEGWGADWRAPTEQPVPSDEPDDLDHEARVRRETMYRRWEEAEMQARKRAAETHEEFVHGEIPADARVDDVPDLRDDEQHEEAERHRRQLHAVNEVWEARNRRVDAEARAEAERLRAEAGDMHAQAEQDRREWLETTGQRPSEPIAKKKRGLFRRKR